MTKLNKSLCVTFTMGLAISLCCLIIGQALTAAIPATKENVERANLIKIACTAPRPGSAG